jgi:TIR domain
MDTRIPVSYAREDQAPVESLVSFLRAAGYDIWFDKDSLHAGQDWRRAIEQEIARADLLIICLSKNSVDKTGFVQKEMRLAVQQAELRPDSQVYIIPVSLDGCPVPQALERWQVLDLREPDAGGRLLKAIGSAIGEGASAPRASYDALASAVSSYNRAPSGQALGPVAQEILDLIEQEPDSEKRGIVEILKEVQPGITHFFPRIQYAGSPKSMKTRLFRGAVGELVSANILFPPEHNPSRNTQTYEYQLH